MSQINYDEVNLMLRLYDLRREPRLRQARSWFGLAGSSACPTTAPFVSDQPQSQCPVNQAVDGGRIQTVSTFLSHNGCWNVAGVDSSAWPNYKSKSRQPPGLYSEF